MPVKTPAKDRFWDKVDRRGPDDCWEWQAGTTSKGYGCFSGNDREHLMAHRFAYELVVGPIPAGHHIDHLCKNVSCVNPNHLEAVTPRENNARSESPTAKHARQTHCKHGHEFTEENTYWRPDRPNGRCCRECRRIRNRAIRNRAAWHTEGKEA